MQEKHLKDLSDTERELYEFIKEKKITTIKEIKDNLSMRHIGALGRLKSYKLIDYEKRPMEHIKYGYKFIKFVKYIVLKKEIE